MRLRLVGTAVFDVGWRIWTSSAAVRSPPRRGRKTISPGLSGSTRASAAAAALSAATVTFEPGARTAWHTHPLGQTLLVTAGLGRAQREGGSIEEIRPGDIVWFEPGEKHWHGASPDCAMTHIAIAEMKDDSAVTWMEKVTDEQYAEREK